MKVLIRSVIVAALALASSTATIRGQDAPVAATPTTPSVETLFADAVAKEAAVRKALATPNPADTLLKAVRSVVDHYELLVKLYPSSTQSDDALWRAGKLSADAFAEFRDPQEQTAAIRLFRLLSTQYPSSKLARQTPAQLSALKAISPAPAAATPVPPPAQASAPPLATPPPATSTGAGFDATDTNVKLRGRRRVPLTSRGRFHSHRRRRLSRRQRSRPSRTFAGRRCATSCAWSSNSIARSCSTTNISTTRRACSSTCRPRRPPHR